MARVVALLVAGLLWLIPTSAFAIGEEKDAPGQRLTTLDVVVMDDAVQSIYAPVDNPGRETGRERSQE